MKPLVFLALTSLIGLNIGCGQKPSPSPITVNTVTKITVTFFNHATRRGDEPLKTISPSEEIALIAKFADQTFSQSSLRSGLCQISRAGDRSTILNLHFYAGDEYRGTFGIGPDGNGGHFFKAHYYGQTHYKCISAGEKKEFLNLIGTSEEEYQRLFSELDPEGTKK